MNYEPVIAGIDTSNFLGTKANETADTNVKVSTPQEEFVLIEKLKFGPTIVPSKMNKSSKEDDVVHDEPKGDKEGDDIPFDAEKVVNEEPKVVEEVQNKESVPVDDIGIFTSSRNFDSTAMPEVSTARKIILLLGQIVQLLSQMIQLLHQKILLLSQEFLLLHQSFLLLINRVDLLLIQTTLMIQTCLLCKISTSKKQSQRSSKLLVCLFSFTNRTQKCS